MLAIQIHLYHQKKIFGGPRPNDHANAQVTISTFPKIGIIALTDKILNLQFLHVNRFFESSGSRMVKFSQIFHFVSTRYAVNHKCRNSFRHPRIDRQTDGQTGRQIDRRQTDRQADRYRQTDRYIDRQIDRQIDIRYDNKYDKTLIFHIYIKVIHK